MLLATKAAANKSSANRQRPRESHRRPSVTISGKQFTHRMSAEDAYLVVMMARQLMRSRDIPSDVPTLKKPSIASLSR